MEFLIKSIAELGKRIQCLELENQYLKKLLTDAGIPCSVKEIVPALPPVGLPMSEFEMDADRTYMITTIRIHEKFETRNDNIAQKMSDVLVHKDYNRVNEIVDFMEEHGKITPKEAETITGKSAATVRRYYKMLADTRHIQIYSLICTAKVSGGIIRKVINRLVDIWIWGNGGTQSGRVFKADRWSGSCVG